MPRTTMGPPPRKGGAVPAVDLASTTTQEICTPIQVVGVQDGSPLAWNADGDVLAAVSSNHSIFLFQLSGQAFKMTKL